MTERLEVWVPGIPAPKGSMKHVGGGRMVDSSKLLPAWRKALEGALDGLVDEPMAPPISVSADFYLPAPHTSKYEGPWGPPDLDKLERAIGDALQLKSGAGVIANDSHITRWRVEKHWATWEPGARIVVARIPSPKPYWKEVHDAEDQDDQT